MLKERKVSKYPVEFVQYFVIVCNDIQTFLSESKVSQCSWVCCTSSYDELLITGTMLVNSSSTKCLLV